MLLFIQTTTKLNFILGKELIQIKAFRKKNTNKQDETSTFGV
jgi:hypothetical protein